MLTPKKNGHSGDFLDEGSLWRHDEAAQAWGRKPLSQILREARERKNMSLPEVAKLTHIPLNYLQLLEGEGDERVVPDSLYLIASLRSYVAFLDIEAGGALTQFIAELDAESPVKEKAGRDKHPPRFFRYFPQQWSRPLAGIMLLLLTLGLLAVLGYYSELSQKPRPADDTGTPSFASLPSPSVSPPAASQQESPAPSPPVSPPVAAAPQAEPSAAPTPRLLAPLGDSPSPMQKSPSSTPHRLRVQATAKTWFHITVDDQPMKRLFLSPGQSLEWSAEKGFTISLGNAGAVKLTLDGQELSPVGKVGQMALNIRLPSPRKSQEREVRNAARPRTAKPR